MRNLTTLLAASLIALLTLSACGAANPTSTPLPQPTPPPNTTAGVAPVDTIEVNVLESNPLQINAVIKGNLPNPCTTITGVTQSRDGYTITLTVNTATETDKACIEVIQPYEQTVTIDTKDLTAGTYTVTSNGISTTFELNQR